MIPLEVGSSKLVVIDTPGFDDTKRSDADILNEIARVLTAQYQLGFELKGIIYMHRITDIKYTGSNNKTFEIFKRICGKDALKNVLLLTSRWNEVDEATGASRERQLRETFWCFMLSHGSCMSRFSGDHSSAVSLTSQLLMKDAVVLCLQREIQEEGKDLRDTSAGSFLDGDLNERRQQALEEIKSLEQRRNELKDSDQAMRRQFERDWEKQKEQLRAAEQQRNTLHNHVGQDVQGEIKIEQSKKSSLKGLKRLIPLIPTSLSLLGLFVGIPPGSFESLFDFILGLGSDC